MIKPANNFLWGIQMSLAFLLLEELKAVSAIRIYRTLRAALILLTVFLTIIAVQYGIELKTWTYFLKKSEGNYYLKSEPLKGWKFYRGQGVPLDNLVEYIKKNIPANESILNLTDMYIVNALTGRDSYRGVPFMFHIVHEHLPRKGKQAEQVRQNILNHLPDWIVWNFEPPMFGIPLLEYLNIKDEIQSAYTPVKRWGRYLLLKRL